jgi:alpha-L-fucosidase 2
MFFKGVKFFFIAAGLLSVNIISSQELKLWYTKPAEKWTDALPLGNGRIGAMIFGGVEKDRIQFNEETLWTGSPRDYNRTGAYKYLDTIRQLLFQGKQKEAEALAEKEFMGLKSDDGKRDTWVKRILQSKNEAAENFNDSRWKTMTVPSWDGWEAVGFEGLDGAVWLRKDFEIPASWLGKDILVDLNRIRDRDLTYVNGKLIGTQENNEPRKYIIPKQLLHAGKNSIAIQVLNYTDKGGITGYKDTTRHIGIYPTGDEASKISLNGEWKYFIQDDNPPAVGTYQASYQPFGDLWLDFKHAAAAMNYRRELDLRTAVATTSYSVNGVNFKREYLVSQPAQVMAIDISASQSASINLDISLTSPHKENMVEVNGKTLIVLHVAVTGSAGRGALKGLSTVRVVTKSGKIVVNQNKIGITGADEVSLYLTAETNYLNYHDVSRELSGAFPYFDNEYGKIKAAHIKEYQQYFNTYSINLGKSANESLPTDERLQKFATSNDPSFVALYQQYDRYLLISASRPGTRPANLQGIWNDLLNPPWGSKYTTNINLEMNYWPAELLNLSPMHEPLFDMITELSHTGRETAREYYNAPGWVLHHNTDLWRGTAPINASNHGIWVTGGAWLCQHLWEHYLFTQDEFFLKTTAYPIMKQAALFFNSYLVKDPKTGWLISTPSNSPEQGGLVAGPSMDHQIIRSLFKNVIAASELLNVDKGLRETLKVRYAKIAPNQIGKYGQLQEWMQDVDDTTNKHRHISHLWAVHPGNEINWDDAPELMKAARQSLIYRGDAATGWSLGWKINCWARFKDGDHAFRLIQMLLSPTKNAAGSYNNLFDAHPPFQIDGNFGSAAGIGEMLLQSHTKYIDILPALPSALPEGVVKGICARGGFVLDIKWNDGQLQELTVRSKAGKELLLRYNNNIVRVHTIKNGVYHFDGSLKQK